MLAFPDLAPAAPANPPPDARAARIAKFRREQLIVDYLNRGVSIAEIAAIVGVGEKRMRAVVRDPRTEIRGLARRMPVAPEEFAAIQMSRLNEALLVAFSAMTNMNLKAVDRVVRIVRELDRYHGRAVALVRSELEQREDAPLSLGERVSPKATGEGRPGPDIRPEIPLEAVEKAESAPEFSAADASPSALPHRALRAAFSREAGEGNARPSPAMRERVSSKATGEGAPAPGIRPEILLQPIDMARFAPGPRGLAAALAAGTAFSRVLAAAAAAASSPPARASLRSIV